MDNCDLRWKQRFQNFLKAFYLLEEAVQKYKKEGLTDLKLQGLIQRYEFTHELAWNVLKDYFDYQEKYFITGSIDAIRKAFNKWLIEDGYGGWK